MSHERQVAPDTIASCPALRRPVAFIAATDLERARRFYEEVLGLRFVADEGVALLFDIAGMPLRVTRVDQFVAQPFTAFGWWVEDTVDAARELAARGVVFRRYPSLEQDALGIWIAPSGARVAWFEDPEGTP